MDFDVAVKLVIYETIARTTRIPSSGEIGQMLNRSPDEVQASFLRLHQKRLVVPEPNDPSRLRMAPPFSGIETSFPVHIAGNTYFANCVWDALGIAAALKEDATIPAKDGHTNEPVKLEVKEGSVLPQDCVIHFAVPAAFWWKDIIYT